MSNEQFRQQAAQRPPATGLKTSDELLCSDLGHDVKIVLAATLAHPTRSPSLTELVSATGLKRETINNAQDKLETFRATGEQLFDAVVADRPIPWGFLPLAVYDRPSGAHERNPTHPQFARANRLAWVQRPYDPEREERWIELPASISGKLPRGKKNSGLFRLVALYYAREQLRRGAIQVTDESVARDLNLYVIRNGFHEEPNVRQVQRIREELVAAGVLVVHNADAKPCPIYTMPGATPGQPERTEEFVPEWTASPRRYRFLHTDATDDQWDAILRLVTRLGDDEAENALWDAGLDPLLDPEPRDKIAALEAAVNRSGNYDLPLGELRDAVGGTKTRHSGNRVVRSTLDLLTLDQKTSSETSQGERSFEPLARGDSAEEQSGEEDQARPATGTTATTHARRFDWGGRWGNLFYFDQQTGTRHQQIERIVFAIERKHGFTEAAQALRAACLDRGPKASAVLAPLARQWGYLIENESYANDEDGEFAAEMDALLTDLHRPVPD